MVGRGAQGAPWRLAQIAQTLYGTPAPVIPEGAALADLVAEHYEAMLAFYGPSLGLRCARKHLGWYLDGVVGEAPRHAMLTADDPAQVLRLIRSAFSGTDRKQVAA
jgi:tRNA-dihydrouridine synthase